MQKKYGPVKKVKKIIGVIGVQEWDNIMPRDQRFIEGVLGFTMAELEIITKLLPEANLRLTRVPGKPMEYRPIPRSENDALIKLKASLEQLLYKAARYEMEFKFQVGYDDPE
jgi:hypothetical protein